MLFILKHLKQWEKLRKNSNNSGPQNSGNTQVYLNCSSQTLVKKCDTHFLVFLSTVKLEAFFSACLHGLGGC